MPNRIIKDSIRTSKKVNQISDFDFRLWVYLITYVDDYGRGSADVEILNSFLFPRKKGVTETQIKKSLTNLAEAGMLTLYYSGDEEYLCFPNWDQHQTIRNKKSKFPEPENICNQMFSSESKCLRNPIQSNPNPNPNTNTNTTRTSANVQRHKYGQYSNVLLSDEDLSKLKNEFPNDWNERIEQLSEYMESTGKKYSSHLATIRSWARKEKKQNANKTNTPEIPEDDETFASIFGDQKGEKWI